MQTELHKHLFNVTDYYRMADTGIFPVGAHVELIEGEVIDMAPIGSRHASVVSALAQTLTLQLGNKAIVRIQDPIHLGSFSVPQPDIAIVKAKADYYREGHPVADDVLLLIEVADSTVDYDLKIKIPLYAKHGIAECWLVDLNKSILFKFVDSNKEGYRTQRIHQINDVIEPEQLSQVRIKLSQFLI